MRDPRNEREAQPHLQRQADLRYRRYEMHKVQPAFKGGRPWHEWLALALVVGMVVAATVILFVYAVKIWKGIV